MYSTLLSDKEIRQLVLEKSITDEVFIHPFVEKLKKTDDSGVPTISYGLSSYGYDIRCSSEFKLAVAKRVPAKYSKFEGQLIAIDPKNPDDFLWNEMTVYRDKNGSFIIMPPNSFALSHSVETFNIPKDIMVQCIGKSTYARAGIVVPITPLEPGWQGQITLEFANTSSVPVKIYVDEGVCQLLFYKQTTLPEVSYADRQGKYQNQSGITLGKA